MFGTGEEFTYLECEGCGSLAIRAVPDDLTPYYPTDYYSVGTDPAALFGDGPRRMAAIAISRTVLFNPFGDGSVLHRLGRRQISLIVRNLQVVRAAGLPRGSQTRVLDVGCGSGSLLYLLSLAGMRRLTGIDPFLSEDEVALSPSARLHRHELSADTGEYDLIMFHHSLEHVASMEDELRTALERLAPDGRILVRMPTPESEAYAAYGPNWFQIDAPRHLSIPSRRGLQALVSRVGLSVRQVIDDSNGIQFWRSEEVALGRPMEDPKGARTENGERLFSDSQLDEWERRAQSLNAQGRGDQAAWILERSAAP